jgi:hypothetical protein
MVEKKDWRNVAAIAERSRRKYQDLLQTRNKHCRDTEEALATQTLRAQAWERRMKRAEDENVKLEVENASLYAELVAIQETDSC